MNLAPFRVEHADGDGAGALFMRCYFLRDNRMAGVEILPLGLSDEDAIARAHTLYSERKGPFEGFEVWDRVRFAFKHLPSADAWRRSAAVRYKPASASRRMTSLSGGATHLVEPVDELGVEPDPHEAVGTWATPRYQSGAQIENMDACMRAGRALSASSTSRCNYASPTPQLW
jgi:hypothetical protein